jgi:hypothetical protein
VVFLLFVAVAFVGILIGVFVGHHYTKEAMEPYRSSLEEEVRQLRSSKWLAASRHDSLPLLEHAIMNQTASVNKDLASKVFNSRYRVTAPTEAFQIDVFEVTDETKKKLSIGGEGGSLELYGGTGGKQS